MIKHGIPGVHFYSPEETIKSKHPQVKTSLNGSMPCTDLPGHSIPRWGGGGL